MTPREIATELQKLCREVDAIENVTIREANDIAHAALYVGAKVGARHAAFDRIQIIGVKP